MQSKIFALEKAELSKEFDRFGDSAAFICPVCGKLVIVGPDGRECPLCHKSTGKISADGKELKIEW